MKAWQKILLVAAVLGGAWYVARPNYVIQFDSKSGQQWLVDQTYGRTWMYVANQWLPVERH